jgi:predicted transcriptional regulator
MDSEMNSTSLIKDAVFYKKDLTMPPTITEMIGVLVIMSITFLANAGGLGGGGLLTPFMLLFFDLSI